jgi:four helix bundle protein
MADERFGLRTLLRKTATEIPSSIAYGTGKRTDAEFAQALFSALGHGSRLEYHLLLSRDLELLAEGDYNLLNDRLVEVKNMISAFGGRLT